MSKPTPFFCNLCKADLTMAGSPDCVICHPDPFADIKREYLCDLCFATVHNHKNDMPKEEPWEDKLEKGLALWIEDVAYYQVARLKQLEKRLEGLRDQIADVEGQCNIIANQLPTGIANLLGYQRTNTVSILPVCYLYAKEHGIPLNEAIKVITERMKVR